MKNFKDIHIGNLIHKAVKDQNIEISRISNFLNCPEEEINDMYLSKSIDTEVLLKWSKLLKYDLFRVYSQHLVLYSPPVNKSVSKNSTLPTFKKNIYTKELIDFILEKIENKTLTKKEVIEKYKIPKTTLYKWIYKYKNNSNES